MATRKIEDVYPLTPMQEGMLFHALYEPETGLYVEQVSCDLLGDLDPRALERAWRRAVERHPVLRTSFVWKRQQQPLQVVHPRVELPFLAVDWSALPAAVQRSRFEDLLAADRAQGFELARAPLMRLQLLRLGERRHRLLWTSHHLLLDGWSLPLLLNEVLAAYEAFAAGGEPRLPPARPFGEYVAWLHRQDLAPAEAFWRRELRGFAAPLPLAGEPAAEQEAAAGSGHREQVLTFTPRESAALQAFAQRARLTVNVLVQGCWALLLGRHGAGDDVVFGVAVSGRGVDFPGIQGMLGLFINTLPLRVQIRPAAPLLPWLRDLQARQLEMQRFETTPLAKIQRWSDVPQGTALFDTLLAYESYPTAALPAGEQGLGLGEVIFRERTNYPLAVSVSPGDSLAVRITHDLRRFAPAAVGRLLRHFRTLLSGVAAAPPEAVLEDLHLLTAPERHQLRVEWNDTASAYPSLPIHEIFEAVVDRAPEAAAVAFADAALTYRQLDGWADRIAHRLLALGVLPGEAVGLASERSAAMVAGLLGILKAGAAYLPLDPSLPAERLAFLIADAGLTAVLTGNLRSPLATADAVRLLPLAEALGGEAGGPAGGQATRPRLPVADTAPAYLTYTSGSTGTPKGIVIPHRAICRLVLGTSYLPFDPGERFAQMASLSFDAATFEIWGALLHGLPLVGISRETALSPWRLEDRLREEAVTTLFVTTALFNQIARERPETFASLRHLLFGGEAVDPGAVRELLRHGFSGRLLHLYGPSESTTFATWFHVREVAAGAATVPIGGPVANTTAFVLDAAGRLAPLGAPGELCLGGDGLAHGYVGRPALTAERFVPDPFAAAPGGRLYRSGDLVRQRPEGAFEFLGRLDNQVKIRGFRIEPGEIEALLGGHPGVSQAAVVPRGQGAARRLVAFVVARPGAALDGDELRSYLRGRTPDYMVPAAFTTVAALPLTANGKVDRRALAGGEPAREEPAAAGEPSGVPRSEVEAALAKVWADVLRVGAVGRHDDFFELGGDSILSIQIVARARQAGVRITPRQLFDHPTIAGLAAVAAGGPPAAAGDQDAVTGEVALTPIQRRFFARGPAEPHHYNQHLLLRVRQPLAPAAVARAVAAVTAHHDALRLRFRREADGWRQWNAGPAEPLPFHAVDLSALGAAALPALTGAAEQIQASLDLARGPIVRAAWLALPAGESRLLLVIHHLAVDGVSWRVILEDLESACRQAARGEAIALPPKTTSFRRWAERLSAHARDLPLAPELAVWRRLADSPAAPLPDLPAGDGATPPRREAHGVAALDREETRALLQEVPRAFRTEINDVLLTALALTLAGPAGSLDVALEGHGREEVVAGVDLTRTVGWFTTLFPVRLEIGGGDDPAAALGAVRAQLRAIPGRGIGFGLLRYLRDDGSEAEALAPLRRMPEPRVAFNYLGQLDQALPEGSLFAPAAEPAGAPVAPGERREFDLTVNARILDGRLEAVWSAAGTPAGEAAVERWAAAFAGHLRGLIAAARARRSALTPADFPLAGLAESELARLLAGAGQEAIEDVYALSPLQEGLLFHSLYAPGFGVYLEQLTCVVAGELDPALVAAAWRLAVERNPVLRTSFRGLELSHPVQVVHAHATVELEEEDWRGLSREEQEDRLAALVRSDRERGFDLSRPPLMRWRLIATGEREHRFFWSYHHVLFDGWSFSALVGELLAAYAALRAGSAPSLPPRAPFRDHIAWLQGRDLAAAEAYWRRELAGFAAPTPLAVDREADAAGGAGTVALRLSPAATAALQARARGHRLTLNTLVQGAWGALLGRYGGRPDVVFGVVVAGRPAELPGVESIIGLFINTLPVRVEAARELPLVPWLRRLQERNLELRHHEQTPLVKVQQWSEVPRGLPLFESILAFESYPLEDALGRGVAGLGIGEVRTFSRASHPLSVAAFPGAELWLRIDYEAGRFDPPTARRLLEHLHNLLAGMAVLADDQPLGDLPLLGAGERHQLLHEWGTEGSAAVCDPSGEPAPIGVPGALRQGDPGELARHLPDGTVERLGRTDPRSARLERRLRALAAAAAAGGAAGEPAAIPARHPVAERLAVLWAEVLGVERVGFEDDFFALGGHSLLVTQLVSRVRAEMGVELPLASLFERPTIAALAADLEALLAAEKGLAALPIVPRPREAGDPPLSFAQERLWFIDQLEPGNPLYNMPAAVRLRGRLRPRALAASLSEIVRRHEVLRTVFQTREAKAVQRLLPPRPLELPLVDLGALAGAAREAELGRWRREEARRPFDLAAGPLVRATLLRLGAEEHAVLWTMHHIVSDGWSMGIFLRELAALYAAFAAGEGSPLPALPVQYADFSWWQRRWLSGEVLERQLAYWRRQLAGIPATPLTLPPDRLRPARPSLRREGATITLPPATAAALGAAAQRQGATPFMALLALFQILLVRCGGPEDLVLGSPIANRNRVETEGLIGFFVNTLVLRTSLAGDPGLAAVLGRVREVCLAAYAHQDLPFERLVEELAPSRRLGLSPLFQVMFALQNAPVGTLALPGLELAPLAGEAAQSEFELVLNAHEGEDGLWISLRYTPELYDGARIRRLLGGLATLAASALAAPEQRLSALPLLSPAERHQLLAEWNDAAVRFADDPVFHELLARQAASAPSAPAVVFGDRTLSYGDLEERAARLARHLRRLGAGPGARVGICLERSLDLVVAIFAALKTGAAYVPLDPESPRERLAFLVADAGVRALVTHERWAATLPAGGPAIVRLDGGAAGAGDAGELAGPADRAAGADDPAYVIYTSGTTGEPKGAVISHRSVVNYARALRAAVYGESAERLRVSLNARVAFDASVKQLSHLLWGHCLVVLPDAVRLDPEGLVHFARRERLDVLDCAPSQLRLLLKAGITAPGGPGVLLVGGEAIDDATWNALRDAGEARGLRAFNHYGPTECTVNTTIRRVAGARPNLGRTIANVEAHLLDARGALVPAGAPGEIHVAGLGVGMGYLHRPALTAERFVPDPFAATPGSRMYRTGDLARHLPDGALEFLGRVDHQVKVRGFRIELGEIESALARHPAVTAAAVLAREEPEGGTRLVAFWAGPEAAGAGDAGLRNHLREKLPDYMVPAAFVRLDRLPLTPNGKVDRRALEALGEEPAAASGTLLPTAPRTPTEELVAELWAALLGRDRVGADDDFFALGGHSLLATRAISRLREAFQVELPLRLLFEASTVEAMAAGIDSAVREGAGLRVPPITPAAAGPLPLSFAQQRLWIVDRIDPGLPAYNMPYPVRLSGDLAAGALAASLAEIVRRHQVLRTRFLDTPDGPLQEVLPAGGFAVPRVDLRALPPRRRQEETTRLATAEAWRRFDLRQGPLLRAVLLDLGYGPESGPESGPGSAGGGPREHALLLTLHHIAADAASIDIVLRELTALYPALAAGRPSPLPEPALQYGDYAAWQRAWMSGESLERQIAYWRERLAGAPSLDLLADHPRPAVQTFRGAHVALHLDGRLARDLRAAGQRRGATLFMVMLAAFQALLHRYTGQEDVVVGSPVSNRDQRETEDLVGFFVNMLALRTRLAAELPFADLLARVREAAVGGYAHRELPFERLVELLAPERDPGRNPLFQAVVQVLRARQAPAGEGLAVHRLPLAGEMAPFELSLTAVELEHGIEGSLQYSADRLDPATALRLVGHLESLLAGAAADPARTLAELPLLSAAEAHQLRMEWNDAGLAVSGELVHERIAALARRDPGAPAVAAGGERLTRGELETRAELLAARLRRLGAAPEARVAVCLERSPGLVVAQLAVLKAGAAFVPLDPAQPAERLAAVLAACGAVATVTRRRFLERLPEDLPGVVCLDELAGSDARAAEPLESVPVIAPESLAYLIYTSGSTGKPKGVAVSHRNLANLVAWVGDLYAIAPGDRASLTFTPAFDGSVFELWPALAAGASLHIPDEEVRLSPARLARWLRAEGITFAQAPTALIEPLLAEEVPGGLGLRRLGTGGDRLRQRPPVGLAFPLLNQYGPTEITVIATAGAVEPGAGAPPAIGRPVGNATVHLLDRALRPVPPGAAGEICIGGAGVARGYWRRPELTAERFVPDPCGPPGARLYRTGDLARHLPDGRLDFLGRFDHQVKIRGFRVELGGVESALLRHPGVVEAVVVAREEAGGTLRLVAYVVPAGEAPADLRDFLKLRVPEFELPAAFVFLAALPLTPQGKVDRRALPEPAAVDPAAAAAPGATGSPRTAIEELLAGLWCDVLGVERVGIHDSFFELGGHSLLATRLATRMREAFGVEVPLLRLFAAPTVAGLAREVERALRGGDGDDAAPLPPPVVPVPRDGDLPLSFAQQRLWILDQLDPGSTAYNVPLAVRLSGELDAAALERSLAEVARRHEVLRTSYPSRRGGPVQEIAPWRGFALPRVELGALPQERREAEARRLARAEARLPFDLARGPVLRPALLALAEREHVLLLGMHHIASDGWSMGVLVREISTLYTAGAAGLPSPLPELPVQYADYAVWQRRWLAGEILERELAWWRQTLAGSRVLELLPDRPHPAVPGSAAGTRRLRVPRETAAALAALARAEGMTPFMVLLAAWKILLCRHTGQRDLAVGSPIANRRQAEVEGLIGFFVNTLVLRTRLPEGESASGALRRVREATLAAFAHQDVPFDLLVERLQARRGLQRTPFFQVLFALQNAPVGRAELPGLTLASLPAESGAAKFELTLSLAEGEDGLDGVLEYRRELFDPATVERLLGHFRTLLAALVADPGRPLAGLPLLSAAERHQLREEWNDTAAAFPREAGLHRLFARRAALAPDAPAVRFGGEGLTYGELDARSNQLARTLRRLGVGLETPVGVCLERSAGLIVAWLGILKAGGFYVPLDPAYPPERLAGMVEDARLPVLLAAEGTVWALPAAGAAGVRMLLLDADRAAIDGESAAPLPATAGEATAANLAYAIYTSGSTGRPKGVAVTHRDVSRLVLESDYVRLGAGDQVAQASNASFDAATFEVWGALLNGARLVGVPREAALEPRALAALLREEEITTLFVTTALFHQLAREVPAGFAGVRHLLFGGEAIDPAAVRRVLAHGGPRRLLHVYGPTETTTFASWHHVDAVPAGAVTVPIGRPIANTRIDLLDGDLRPVPAASPGELCIGGEGLARGYLHQPALTAERFVPDPGSAAPGARLYRTGDLARRRPDGAIEFLGRLDRQVKIRGFRIEPGEVEAALAAHPALTGAAVEVRDDGAGERRLVAYVAAPPPAPAVADLQAFLRRGLPDFMVPAVFVLLPALPLTPNGKLDRAALPDPGEGERSRQATYAPPRTASEERIADVWSQVLGVAQVGIHDNFFDLGGHSLAIIQVVSRLRETLGRELSAVDLFQHPTVAALAAHLEPEGARPAAGLATSQSRGASRRELRLQRRGAVAGGPGAAGEGGHAAEAGKEEA